LNFQIYSTVSPRIGFSIIWYIFHNTYVFSRLSHTSARAQIHQERQWITASGPSLCPYAKKRVFAYHTYKGCSYQFSQTNGKNCKNTGKLPLSQRINIIPWTNF